MYRIISDHNVIDRHDWSVFVSDHPNGNIFHTPEMVDLYERSSGFIPLVIFCIDENTKLSGILVAAVQQTFNGPIGLLTARAIVWGGPLVINEDDTITYLILKEFDKMCKKRVIYSQFRNLWDISLNKSVFLKTGYLFEDHLDIIFDLHKKRDDLYYDMHPTRRKQINRSLKRGVSSKVVDNLKIEELRSCFLILKKVYHRTKLPLPPIDYFQNSIVLFQSKGWLKAILAIHNNTIIGFRFFLCYNGLLYDWYAGSLPEYLDRYPNDILPWEIMKWGQENGFDMFDFGGAGKPAIPYGVRDYKLKFGGTLINYGRYEKVYNQLVYFVANYFLKMLHKLKNKNSSRLAP